MNKISCKYLIGLITLFNNATFAAETPQQAEYVGSLISACADGQMHICEQINQLEHPPEAVSAIDTMAIDFAKKAKDLNLEEDNLPNLLKAYPLIISDYFSNEKISKENRQKWFKKDELENCAQHYHIKWRIEKSWWPILKSGAPDWRTLYPHILDHYFGYCVMQ